MAVVIRLRRTGTRNRPAYRVVVADKRKPRDGRFIETLGHYEPLREPAIVNIDGERAVHWLQHGAVPSETVASLFKREGITREGVADKPEPDAVEVEEPEADEVEQDEETVAADSPIG